MYACCQWRDAIVGTNAALNAANCCCSQSELTSCRCQSDQLLLLLLLLAVVSHRTASQPLPLQRPQVNHYLLTDFDHLREYTFAF